MIQTSTNHLTNEQFFKKITNNPDVKERIENCDVLSRLHSNPHVDNPTNNIPLDITHENLKDKLSYNKRLFTVCIMVPRNQLKNVILRITNLNSDNYPDNVQQLHDELKTEYEVVDFADTLPF